MATLRNNWSAVDDARLRRATICHLGVWRTPGGFACVKQCANEEATRGPRRYGSPPQRRLNGFHPPDGGGGGGAGAVCHEKKVLGGGGGGGGGLRLSSRLVARLDMTPAASRQSKSA